jgi:NAD(P) transhydrogenase subunit alpha
MITNCGDHLRELILRFASPNIKIKEGTVPAGFISNLYVFILAGFVGFEVIRRVSPLLHTPLMALTNALDAIVVVAAIIMVGGFLITDRMLRMFKLSGRKKQ